MSSPNRNETFQSCMQLAKNNPTTNISDITFKNMNDYALFYKEVNVSSVYQNILDTSNVTWNRQYFGLDSTSLTKVLYFTNGKCLLNIPEINNKGFINKITIIGNNLKNNDISFVICNVEMKLSVMYYHLTQENSHDQVELSNIASFDQPLPLCLLRYSHIEISFIDKNIPMHNLSVSIEYTNTSHTKEWIDNFINKTIIISRKIYGIYEQRIDINEIKSIIDYSNYLPHTGFIIQYNDGDDHLDQLNAKYDANIGGYIGCWGGNFGGYNQKWIVSDIDVNKKQSNDKQTYYMISYTNCHDTLMPKQLNYALNMTPLRCELQLSHSSMASYINIYHVYCNILDIGGGMCGQRYHL